MQVLNVNCLRNSFVHFNVAGLGLLALGACSGGSDGESTANTTDNRAPSISGTPPGTVEIGDSYSFTPTASDADGDELIFSITGKPDWAVFESTSGHLYGTPVAGDAGTYTDIDIEVSDGTNSSALAAFSIEVLNGNSAPTIGGSPPVAVNANTTYSFTPTATDPDGDALSFSVVNSPDWATLDTGNGTLSGTPGNADVAVYSDISISVSDGTDTATLGPFSITVNAISNGSATLSWDPPTENTDGSALTDLAGYNLYWRTGSGDFANSIRIDNPGVTTYTIGNLAPGTYEFAASGFTVEDIESDLSPSVFKTVP